MTEPQIFGVAVITLSIIAIFLIIVFGGNKKKSTDSPLPATNPKIKSMNPYSEGDYVCVETTAINGHNMGTLGIVSGINGDHVDVMDTHEHVMNHTRWGLRLATHEEADDFRRLSAELAKIKMDEDLTEADLNADEDTLNAADTVTNTLVNAAASMSIDPENKAQKIESIVAEFPNAIDRLREHFIVIGSITKEEARNYYGISGKASMKTYANTLRKEGLAVNYNQEEKNYVLNATIKLTEEHVQ